MRSTLIICALGALALASCKRPVGATAAAPRAAADDPRLLRAQEAIGQLKQQLKRALMRAMPAGAAKAIAVCATEAPAIGARLSTGGVTVGRSSHKLRNPQNAPAPWLRPLIAELQRAPRAAGTFRAVELPGGALGYAEPIHVGGFCLTCHGRSIPEAVAAALRQRYPTDRATGFAAGAFRGVFWAQVKPQPR